MSSNKKLNSMINWTKKHLKYKGRDDDKTSSNTFVKTFSRRFSKSKKRSNNGVTELSSELNSESVSRQSRNSTRSSPEKSTQNMPHSLNQHKDSLTKQESSSLKNYRPSPKTSDNSSHTSEISYTSTTSQVTRQNNDHISIHSRISEVINNPVVSSTNISAADPGEEVSDGCDISKSSEKDISKSPEKEIYKSPEINTSKSPEINVPKSPEIIITPTDPIILQTKSPSKEPPIQYPEDLNPFDDEDCIEMKNEEFQLKRISYPIDMNPFGIDTEEENDLSPKRTLFASQNHEHSIFVKNPEPPTPPPEKRKIGSYRQMGEIKFNITENQDSRISVIKVNEDISCPKTIETEQTIPSISSLQHTSQGAETVNSSEPLARNSVNNEGSINISDHASNGENPASSLCVQKVQNDNTSNVGINIENNVSIDDADISINNKIETTTNNNGIVVTIDKNNSNNNDQLKPKATEINTEEKHENNSDINGCLEIEQPNNISSNPFDDDEDEIISELPELDKTPNFKCSTNPFDDEDDEILENQEYTKDKISNEYSYNNIPKSSTPIHNKMITNGHGLTSQREEFSSNLPTPIPRRHKRLHGSTMCLQPPQLYSPRVATSTLSLNTSYEYGSNDYYEENTEADSRFLRNDGGRGSISTGSLGRFRRDGVMSSMPQNSRLNLKKKRRAPLPPHHMSLVNGSPSSNNGVCDTSPYRNLSNFDRCSSTLSLRKNAPPRPPPPKFKIII